jgi:hypothetical protein
MTEHNHVYVGLASLGGVEVPLLGEWLVRLRGTIADDHFLCTNCRDSVGIVVWSAHRLADPEPCEWCQATVQKRLRQEMSDVAFHETPFAPGEYGPCMVCRHAVGDHAAGGRCTKCKCPWPEVDGGPE